MNRQQQALAIRRERLLAQSTAQRSAIIASTEPLLRGAATLDRIVGPIQRHPVLAAVAVGAVALIGSRKIFDLATRAATIYMLLRRR